MRSLSIELLCLWSLLCASDAFVITTPASTPFARGRITSTSLAATTRPPSADRRQALLARNGPFFSLDRFKGKIEFGATANLVTVLEKSASAQGSSADDICVWLQDERSLALSIWDENLMQERGDSVYRLQVMTLQFVTLQLAPWVDVQMKTTVDPVSQQPVFTVQSVGYDPNIQLLPGMRISADTLGIEIEVAGELRPSADGKGVTGGIAFQTTGLLPPPMRILPEQVLKAASDAINQTIVNFAIASFQEGATSKYREFQQKQQQ